MYEKNCFRRPNIDHKVNVQNTVVKRLKNEVLLRIQSLNVFTCDILGN